MARIAGVDIPRDKRVVISPPPAPGPGPPPAKAPPPATGISEAIRV